MAGSVTNLQTLWTEAEAYDATWISVGTVTAALDQDNYIQNAGSISYTWGAASTVNGVLKNYGSTQNISNTHLYVWFNCITAKKLAAIASGGVRIRVTGSSTSNFGEWYVAGSDTWDGAWKCFIIDTSKSFSNTGGTPPSLSSIQHIGVVTYSTFKITKYPPCFVDAIRYGSGLRIDGGSVGSEGTIQDLIDADEGTVANRYGVIRTSGGVVFVQGEIQFGNGTSGNTYFKDTTGKIIVFENPKYYYSGSLVDAVSSTLFKLKFQSSNGATSSFILGTKAGSGDAAVGTGGVTVTSPNYRYAVDAANAYIGTLKLYGCSFRHSAAVDIGSTSVQLPSTATVELVDDSFIDCNQVTRNVHSSATRHFLHNKIVGGADTTANMRLSDSIAGSGTEFNVYSCDGWTSKNDSTTETLSLRTHDFNSIDTSGDYWIYLYAKKTWNMVDRSGTPVVTDQTDFKFGTNDANKVNEKFSCNITAKTATGTLLQDVYTRVYESKNRACPSDNIQTTNSSGYCTSDVLTREIVDNGAGGLTVTKYGNWESTKLFAVRAYKYTYQPYIATQDFNAKVDITMPLVADPNITEQTQATAISNGSGITLTRHHSGETDTRPMKVMHFDGGSGTKPSVGATISKVGGGGGSATVVEVVGDNVSGYFVLQSWNGTEYANNDAIQDGAGWTGSADVSGDTLSFYKEYTWLVMGNGYSLNIIYDYLMAKLANASPDAIFAKAILWGAEKKAQLLYRGSSGFYTARSDGVDGDYEGVWVSNVGSGTISQWISDDNTAFTPPVSVTLEINGLKGNAWSETARCYIATDPGGVVLMNKVADGTGKAQEPYTYTSPQAVIVRARLRGFLPFESSGTITASGLTVTAVWLVDQNSD